MAIRVRLKAGERDFIWGDERLGYSIQKRPNVTFPWRVEVWVARQPILAFDADNKKEVLAYATRRRKHFYGNKSFAQVRKEIGIT